MKSGEENGISMVAYILRKISENNCAKFGSD